MKTTRKMRSKNGMSAVELAVGSFFFVVLTLLCADVAVLIIANGVNNEACRDAARAAGIAPPSKAEAAAKNALTSHQRTDGNFIKDLRVVKFIYNGVKPFGTANSLDPDNQPTVFVATRLQVSLPAPIVFFGGASFTGNNGNGSLAFESSYLYPILNLQSSVPDDVFDPEHQQIFNGQLAEVPGLCNNPPPSCPPLNGPGPGPGPGNNGPGPGPGPTNGPGPGPGPGPGNPGPGPGPGPVSGGGGESPYP